MVTTVAAHLNAKARCGCPIEIGILAHILFVNICCASQAHIAEMSKVGRTRVVVVLLCLTAVGVFYKSKWNLAFMYSLRPLNLSLCSCQKCLTESNKELKELLDVSPKPFLSKRDRTSEDEFNWWKHLQLEKRPFSFFNETVNQLFTIFPPVPDVESSSSDHCRTCAVVGNSGNLKGSHYGTLIDDHDIIIRMNRGRTKGYEKDIKDLLWLLKTFTPRENGQENPEKRGNKDLVMILNPAFMKYVHEMWLKKRAKYPSTGFMAFALSLQMCDEVSVFGFGADREGNWNHYFETLRIKNLRTGPHPGMQEYELIQQLDQKQIIRFFKGL
ncbi:CMP-N-acetylneuraminate-beta-galactosamide-alpha-2,3-sialyltransferase 1-like isoform X2 [Dunckerocampus dactyliophorus]|uniref:CMP-N-acetylneuraminate-beta-galactosamide- alpha-2,3-sialyltransferase 1-like isoform X2 n=1 Tax=Dunckerocampus dactyliophorus TaxID=161453 RepID=UPI002404F71E|nr:CMP-N-acetylneuraminate-beta-galactosamide-alpha-2,3-sialyltransferase 1-like isoform X2 [Dunckerocampus dactyliophorus]